MYLCSTGHANRRRSPTAQRVEESISYLSSLYCFLRRRRCESSQINAFTFHTPYSNFLFSTNQKKEDDTFSFFSLSNVRLNKSIHSMYILMIG